MTYVLRYMVDMNTVLMPVCSLPGLTNRLVSEVIKANPNTVIVNQSGTPVEMPWISEAHTLLQVSLHYTLNYHTFEQPLLVGILWWQRGWQRYC